MYNDFVMVGPATDIGRTHGDAIGWHVEHRVGQLLAQAVHAPNHHKVVDVSIMWASSRNRGLTTRSNHRSST